MTGAYLRVKRDGEWENIEVEYLTDEERKDKLSDDPRLIHWLHMVCHNLTRLENKVCKLFDKAVETGFIKK